MNGITHQQANEYIHIGLPGLEENQQRALEAHLGKCPNCQDYSNLQRRLAAELSHAMHNRWDGQLSYVTKPHKITSGVRRNTMLRNALTFTYTSVVLGALILGLFAVFNWVLLPALVPGPSSRSTETSAANLPLQLDPSVCNEKAYPAPSGVKLPYPANRVIGGGSVQSGNFTFQIYLYCDDTLHPDNPRRFSEIAGLGIAANWRYSGPDQEGQFQYLSGIEPAVKLKTGLAGLKKGDEGGYNSGLSFPDRSDTAWQLPGLAKSGRTIQFSIQVGNGEVMDGASLSFKLQEGEGGYLLVDIVTTSKPGTKSPVVTTPGPARGNCAVRTQTVLYTVQSGDTILGIADYYCLKPETIYWANYDLLKLNKNSLVVGLDIKIPAKDGELLWGPPSYEAGNPELASRLGPGACVDAVRNIPGTGSFIWPTDRHETAGQDYSPDLNHFGIDLAGNPGDPVVAADAGVVVFAGWNNWGYGNMVVIDHGDGKQTLYAHLSSVDVACGQQLAQGDNIGEVGRTGNATASMLHFEIIMNNTHVNPQEYLPAK